MGCHEKTRCRVHEGTGEPRTVLRDIRQTRTPMILFSHWAPTCSDSQAKGGPLGQKSEKEKNKRPLNGSDLGDCRRYHFKPSVKLDC